MTQVRVQNERSERAVIDSEDVVASTTAGVIDVLEFPEVAVADTGVPSSVRSGRAGINDPGAVNALAVLQASGETAFQISKRPKPLVSIPTADLISHTSFKSGSKFVIRVVPQQDNKARDKNAGNQAANDQALYFDRASLQTTSEVHEERYQLFEAFDSETLFLFGERPKIWSFQFLVVNAERPRVPAALNQPGAEEAREQFLRRWNMDYCDELIRRYDKYYRGSAALKLKARTYLSYEDVLIEATLVGLVASRNNTVPGAANIGITFVVHQRQFMGEDLTFGADATLKELLASEDQRNLITRNVLPTAIVPSKKSAEQLLAQYAQNQDEAQDSQARATSIQQESSALSAAESAAMEFQDAADDLVNELAAQLEGETDPEAVAALNQQLTAARKQRDEAAAFVQEARALSGAREEDLQAATSENEVAIAKQRTTEAQLAQNPSGDLTQASQSLVYYVTQVATNADGTRTMYEFRETSEASANLLASRLAAGEIPDDANPISEVTLDPSSPEVAGQPDGVTTSKERAYS